MDFNYFDIHFLFVFFRTKSHKRTYDERTDEPLLHIPNRIMCARGLELNTRIRISNIKIAYLWKIRSSIASYERPAF